MLILKLLLVLTVVLCSCAGPRTTGESETQDGVATLIAAERSFARAAGEKGTRDGFLEYLAGDAVIFRPNPVNARDWYTENQNVTGLLSWEPSYAEISSSGDMGYTTGPWEFRQNASDAEAASYGHYISVWKKQPDGVWRVVLDMGNVHPRLAKKATKVESRVGSPSRLGLSTDVDRNKEREVLLATDRIFSEESEKDGVIAAYMSFSTDDIRFYRMGATPVKGKTRTRTALKDVIGTMTWDPLYADVSQAGDFGYTYGTSELRGDEPGAAIETSSYLRIWRIDPDGRWSLSLDITLPSGTTPAEPEDDEQLEED